MLFIPINQKDGYTDGVTAAVEMMVRLFRVAGIDMDSRSKELDSILTGVITHQASLIQSSDGVTGDQVHAINTAHGEIAKAVFAGIFTLDEFYRRFPEYRYAQS